MTIILRWRSAPAVLLLAASAVACRHRSVPEQTAITASCEPAPAQAVRDMDMGLLQGTFDATFVAVAGPRAGTTARGLLVLRPQHAALLSIANFDTLTLVHQPAFGSLDLPLEEIGATRMGDPTATDSAMPGVGVYVTSGRGGETTSVTARVGSASNVRGQQVFDGGYFALYLRRLDAQGIWGGWASAPGTVGLTTSEASGHFCVRRR